MPTIAVTPASSASSTTASKLVADGDDREVDALRYVAERAEGGPAEDCGRAPVHEIDGAAVGAAQSALSDPVPPLARIVGRADDGHRGRIEQRLQPVVARRRAAHAGAPSDPGGERRGGSPPAPHASAPPSMAIVVPVMYPAAGEARKAMTSPTSVAVPSRPSGTLRSQARICASEYVAVSPSLSTVPTAMQSERMPNRLHSSASPDVRFSRAARRRRHVQRPRPHGAG